MSNIQPVKISDQKRVKAAAMLRELLPSRPDGALAISLRIDQVHHLLDALEE